MKQSMKKAALVLMLALAVLLVPEQYSAGGHNAVGHHHGQ